MFRVGIITASDKGSTGQREDKSGLVIREIVEEKGYKVEKQVILPDDLDSLSNEMINMCDNLKIDLILTTGGTGFAKRDVTPEATLKVIDRLVPGIPEAMRNFSLQFTPRAMLSRATSGIRKDTTLIINLPGSPKAVRETLEYIIDSVHHGLEIMTGRDSECAR
ncbi:molybdopterin adenylyltransferase [Gottschalkia acidurici 9a]|uniref:Molybdopterin adenylyltransferase n=1 Tax=Gottschalkia acidurici (strain ATCC 7906 / DSM 604 / BCRC 14475 / CIP 104303 / KCTC 5404 / NCIMB 10678 / 9a) TaxID=1128398 RepID=K0B619_GOTA9|nr:molybdopterin adenylyltransferase [Gottschalkia acidurici]AFS79901.1 molybdopterin adenylyltransferase [Gottschalkia acidurici 9a]